MNRCLSVFNQVVAAVSVMTICMIAVCAVAKKCGLLLLPEWSFNWGAPVLTAGAVGYLTNYAAIWLLFRPYRQIRWLWGIQGVIPREQSTLAKRLGEEIPKNLLPAEELSEQLAVMIRNYIQNRELIDDLRAKVNLFMSRYKSYVAAFLVPHIAVALRAAAQNNLTPEKLRTFYDRIIAKWLHNPENRRWIASGIISELQERAPDLTANAKSMIRSGVQSYVQEEYPNLSKFFYADEFAAKMVTQLNWSRIESKIQSTLGEAGTINAIGDELTTLSGRLRQYLYSPAISADLEKVIAESSSNAEISIRNWLEENLPVMIDEYLRSEELWQTIETKLLPLMQSFIVHRLKQDKHTIIAGLNFSGRIEKAIMAQDAAEVHALINRISGEHLVYLQLLGYGLGGLAGILLSLAR